jgi:hypothetical protein
LAQTSLAQGSVLAQGSKKLIELGWDMPSILDIAENCDTMPSTTPFDGVVVRVSIVPDKPFGDYEVLNDDNVLIPLKWDAAWLEQSFKDLTSCTYTTFTDNFIRVNTTPCGQKVPELCNSIQGVSQIQKNGRRTSQQRL